MNAARSERSLWTLEVGTVARVPVRVHLTLFLLLAWIGFSELQAGGSAIREVIFVSLLFCCVALHELAHALTARYFGIETRDIVLYPFGGVASLRTAPPPGPEFVIAAAGPAMNIFLAILALPFIDLGALLAGSPDLSLRLFVANLFLGLFNLLPALPMDGGRLLRAGLALSGNSRSTVIASRVSQVVSLLLGAAGLITGNLLLIAVAIVVFTGAAQERLREESQQSASGHVAAEVMTDVGELVTLPHGTTVSAALPRAIKSFQHFFPVVLGDRVLGIVSRDQLLEAGAIEEEELYVSELMDREYATAHPEEPMAHLMGRFETGPAQPVLVMREGRLLGMVVREKLVEFLLVHGLRRHRSRS